MSAMSYDLTLLDLPAELAELRAIAYREPMSDAFKRYLVSVEPFSLHLNIVAMGFCREQMARFGMLAEGRHEPFPQGPPWDRSVYSSENEHRRANPAVWSIYDEAEHRASCQRGAGTGIARFKLESNGPWIVVAQEIAEALSVYDGVSARVRSDAETDEVWGSWIAWLKRAGMGFEVG